MGRHDEWLDAIVGHLREQEIGGAVVSGGALARPAAVDLPVPEGEDQEVREPDQHAGADQRTGLGDVVVQQVVGECAQGVDVGGADESGQPQRDPPAHGVLVLDLVGGDEEHADQQRCLEARDQPDRADREPCRKQQLERDRGEHRQPGPARTALRRQVVGRDGQAEGRLLGWS